MTEKRDNIQPVVGSIIKGIPATEEGGVFYMKVERVDLNRKRCYGYQIDKDGNPTGDYRARSFENSQVIE